MSINSFEELRAEVIGSGKRARVVVAVAQEEHTLTAVTKACEDGFVTPILVGDGPKIREILSSLGKDPDSFLIENRPLVGEAVSHSVELVRSGDADVLMKGIVETRDLMRAVVSRETGLRTGRTMSLVAVFEVPGYHKLLTISDVGVNTTPDLEGKRHILQNAVECLHSLGYVNPKVAVLSSGEEVNPKVPSSIDAAKLKELGASGEIDGCVIEGPISFDLATDPQAAKVKGYKSEVAGDADLLVVPDIVSGNLLAKSLLGFAGARTAGLVCGARAPIVLTSRAASVQDKYNSLVLATFAASKE